MFVRAGGGEKRSISEGVSVDVVVLFSSSEGGVPAVEERAYTRVKRAIP